MKSGTKLCVWLAACLLLTGCNEIRQEQPDTTEKTADTGFVAERPGVYDSADTAVMVKRNKEEETVTFFNIPTGRNYTLSYDGTTVVQDKYGEAMSMEQLAPGDILDVTFLKSKKKLSSIAVSAQVWSNQAVGNYEINQNARGLLVGKKQYKLADNVMVVSEGKQAELADINECDSLLLKGADQTIYSITITTGHGYLRLANAEYFLEGWLEIGEDMILPVTEDMLVTVPEGKHSVLISKKGHGGEKEITIARNEEITLDVGDLKGEDIQLGEVLFTTAPAETSIYIDGDKADVSKPVSLEYGVHQLIAKADGYDTITRYFRVGQPYANLDVELEEAQDETVSENDMLKDGISGNGISANSSISENNADVQGAAAAGSYRVYITAPEGAEVYFDGNYMGLAPVNFKKAAGSHVITLRKSGCQTRSFTMQIDDEKKDLSLAFSELEKISITKE